MNKKIKRLVVFASGGGSNFKAIHKAIINKEISGSIKLLISDNPEAQAIEYANFKNIPTLVVKRLNFTNTTDYSEQLLISVNNIKPDLIILAGYLKKIPNIIIKAYSRKILNIHPALLPKFGGKGYYGINVHKAVIDSNEKVTGPTVHFVSDNYDEGPIIFQKSIGINDSDTPVTLAKRVLEIEHMIFPYVVKCYCDNKINWHNGKPIISK